MFNAIVVRFGALDVCVCNKWKNKKSFFFHYVKIWVMIENLWLVCDSMYSETWWMIDSILHGLFSFIVHSFDRRIRTKIFYVSITPWIVIDPWKQTIFLPLDQWFSTRVPRHFGVPRNSENATVIYLKILKLCRDNKKVENHCSSQFEDVSRIF